MRNSNGRPLSMRNSNGYEHLVAFESLKWKRFVQRKIKFGGRSEWNKRCWGLAVAQLPPPHSLKEIEIYTFVYMVPKQSDGRSEWRNGRRYMFWKEIGIGPTLNQIKDFTGSNPVSETKKILGTKAIKLVLTLN